jgi:predicted ArsR family transcriptional regulator
LKSQTGASSARFLWALAQRGVSRQTARKYLDALVAEGFLQKQKIWRETFYLNPPLMDILRS